MILKGFKEKSNKKYFNKLLGNRVISNPAKPIESLGVIISLDEVKTTAHIKSLAKLLNVNPSKFKIVAYSSLEIDEINAEIPIFKAKDIGWHGTIKNKDLEAFLDTEFDALISYYFEDNLNLKLVTAAANAAFKIGVLQEEQRLNDLIINVNQEAFEVFKSELLKYLSILKRI